MPLYDSPPFTVSILKPVSSTDAGGGVLLVYETRESGVKGILNSASSSEKELFAQQGMTVSHTFVLYGITSAQRGDKLSYSGRSLHIVGIVANEAMGNIPSLSRLILDEQI